MKDENKELLNDSILIKASKDSYLKKEDLIKMLENLNFTEVKDVNISCITGYKIKYNDKNEKYIQTFGYDIRIN